MRLPVPAVAGVLLLSTLAGACAGPPAMPPVGPATTVTVTVDVRCTDQSVSFTLSPWSAAVPRNGTVEWQLDPNANTSEISIIRKQSAWPFVNGGPYRGRKDVPARAGAMKSNPMIGRPYGYTVELTCQPAVGPAHRVVIDPDVVVN